MAAWIGPNYKFAQYKNKFSDAKTVWSDNFMKISPDRFEIVKCGEMFTSENVKN